MERLENTPPELGACKENAICASEGRDSSRTRAKKNRLIVVSNRVALPETQHAGGLGQAMHSALAEIGGVWFGWSGHVVDQPVLHVRRDGAIRLVTRDLDTADHRDYYLGFSNRVLWPLLHSRLDLVAFDREALQGYLRVNAQFAESIRRIARRDDDIWIHDYHLIPLARMLRERGVSSRIGFFLHVPVPPAEMLMSLPAHAELLPALAACDLVGVQTEQDAAHLRDYFRRLQASTTVVGTPRIEAHPIGIDPDVTRSNAEAAIRSPDVARLRGSLLACELVIGVDRLDYTKGLPQRFRAYERLLELRPQLCGRIAFLQIAPPTRCGVPEYQTLDDELQHLTGRINGRYADPVWTPIRYVRRNLAHPELTGYYRAAKVGVVTPLRDGMNLVAKEYVASQDADDPGVLVLSEFAGAARELAGALLVNPFDLDQCAEAMHTALTMPLGERRSRWQAMMGLLRRHDVHIWRNEFLDALSAARGNHRALAGIDEGDDAASHRYASSRARAPAASGSAATPQFAPAL